jgi:hypothetical protein
VNTPITVRGTHNNPKGNYWLVTNEGNRYWIKCIVTFRPNGRWEEKPDTGYGPKRATILLVRVSDLQTTFEDWLRNANRTKDWSPLVLPQTITKKDLIIVDSVVVNVAAK